ncbi:MAG: ribonuclease PH [Bacillota bacterium]
MATDSRRDSCQLRPVKIEVGFMPQAEGSALITMGSTIVACTASVEERVPPFLKGTGSGWVTAEYGMLPRSTKVRRPRPETTGKPDGRAQEIQRLVGRSLRAVTRLTELGERTLIVDCDVIQADGGTRTAAVTGGFVALACALDKLARPAGAGAIPLTDFVAAVSVGLHGSGLTLDMNFVADATAGVDLNLVMTGSGTIVEVQATAEGRPFTQAQLSAMLALGASGIRQLIAFQREALGPLTEAVGR